MVLMASVKHVHGKVSAREKNTGSKRVEIKKKHQRTTFGHGRISERRDKDVICGMFIDRHLIGCIRGVTDTLDLSVANGNVAEDRANHHEGD
jgi:hypothetical protein